MAERVINQKRTQFLNTFAPVNVSLDELIREKLKCGKFPLTKTGWIKVVAMLVCTASLALFLAQNWDLCTKKPDWYSAVFLTCVGSNLGMELLLYLIFSCGVTIRSPGKWVTADIILNLIFSIVGIVGGVLSTTVKISCSENVNLHEIPGPLGIAGGILSAIGCAAIFLMYRYVDEEDELEVPQTPLERNIDLRKSMHA